MNWLLLAAMWPGRLLLQLRGQVVYCCRNAARSSAAEPRGQVVCYCSNGARSSAIAATGPGRLLLQLRGQVICCCSYMARSSAIAAMGARSSAAAATWPGRLLFQLRGQVICYCSYMVRSSAAAATWPGRLQTVWKLDVGLLRQASRRLGGWISGTFTELRTTSFIESTGIACSDSVSHNRVQVLSIPVLLLVCCQDWTCNLLMIVFLEA